MQRFSVNIKNIQKRLFRHSFLMISKWVKSGQLYYHHQLMLTFFTVQYGDKLPWCRPFSLWASHNFSVTYFAVSYWVIYWVHLIKDMYSTHRVDWKQHHHFNKMIMIECFHTMICIRPQLFTGISLSLSALIRSDVSLLSHISRKQ